MKKLLNYMMNIFIKIKMNLKTIMVWNMVIHLDIVI